MSNPSFPNPAEVCKSRGWQVGDKVKTATGGIQEITFIGRDYIHTLGCLGSPFTWERHEHIAHWSKVEPPPVVTIEPTGSRDGFLIHINGKPLLRATSTSAGDIAISRKEINRITRIMAEAGKAATEADLGAGKDAAGTEPPPVWTADADTVRIGILRNGVRVGHLCLISPATEDDKDRFMAAGLAALHGEAKQPVATQEGPWRVDRKCEPSLGIVNGDRVALSVMHHGGHVEYREISERHAHQMAAELNALHAKANVKADQT